MTQSRLHSRCGNAFMVTVVLISIILFIVIGPFTKTLTSRLISRVLLIPVISGIAYEYIRWAAKMMDKSAFVRLIITPNLWMQKLTTKEPTKEMLEVAIAAFNRMYALEQETVGAQP